LHLLHMQNIYTNLITNISGILILVKEQSLNI